jgi:hypothetical protein
VPYRIHGWALLVWWAILLGSLVWCIVIPVGLTWIPGLAMLVAWIFLVNHWLARHPKARAAYVALVVVPWVGMIAAVAGLRRVFGVPS